MACNCVPGRPTPKLRLNPGGESNARERRFAAAAFNNPNHLGSETNHKQERVSSLGGICVVGRRSALVLTKSLQCLWIDVG